MTLTQRRHQGTIHRVPSPVELAPGHREEAQHIAVGSPFVEPRQRIGDVGHVSQRGRNAEGEQVFEPAQFCPQALDPGREVRLDQ